MSERLRNRKLGFKISSGTPGWKIYLVIFPLHLVGTSIHMKTIYTS